MGQDKALLVHHGQPLIVQACTAALACTSDVSVLTPWPQRYRPLLPPYVSLHRETQLNSQPAPGPLVALHTFLQTLPSDPPPTWLLLLACDWVGLSGAALQAGRCELARLTHDAYLPTGPKGWEPLHGFYRTAALRQTLPLAIDQGTYSFQAWLQTLAVVPWPLDRTQLLNCNTHEDWQQVQSRG